MERKILMKEAVSIVPRYTSRCIRKRDAYRVYLQIASFLHLGKYFVSFILRWKAEPGNMLKKWYTKI